MGGADKKYIKREDKSRSESEVPEGYKRTEVGVIPEDWGCCFLSNVITSFRNGYAFASHGYVKVGIPIVTMAQIGLDGSFQFDEDSVNYWSLFESSFLTAFQLFKGDIIIAMTDVTPQKNLIGRMTEVNEDGPLLLNQRVGLLRLALTKIDPYFLRAISNSREWREYSRAVASLGVQANIGRTDILSGIIPLPPLPEQRAIAEALSDADDLIQSLEKLIAKKRAIKLATMQQLLTGKTRLLGYTGEWEKKRLGYIAAFFKGTGLAKSELNVDGNRQCIHYGELFTKYPAKIETVLSRTNNEGSYLYSEADDILMPSSDVTPNGLATASCLKQSGIILGGDILIIRLSTDGASGEFIANMIRNSYSQIMQLVSGIAVYHLYAKDMKSFEFNAPNIEEQTAISAILSTMDSEITFHERKLKKTKLIKKGMMQQLLTGRIRLVKPEVTA